MINPLEAVIQYLKGAGLSTSNIASKHRYGDKWQVGDSGIVVRLDGGEPDIYAPVQNPRLEVRCYASTVYLATQLLLEIVGLSRSTSRSIITTQAGNALVFNLVQASGMSTLFDPELKMDFALMFFNAIVSEIGV